MKTLIFSQCFIKDEEQGKLLGASLALARRLNPGFDILLLDNASPIQPMFANGWRMAAVEGKPVTLGYDHCLRFPDSIGHFSPKFNAEHDNPRDGPGRAIMTGLQIAMDSGYDRAVYLESDALFAKPFEDGFAQMTKPTAMLPRTKWGYLETNVMWFSDLKWLKDFDLIARYNWPAQSKHTQGPNNEGERHYERILGAYLQILNYKGGRGDNYLTARNMRMLFPRGIDFVTHCDMAGYAEFLRINGHDDLAEKMT